MSDTGVSIATMDDEVIIAKALVRGSSHQGENVVFYRDEDHGYVISIDDAMLLPIEYEKLELVYSDMCGSCYRVSDIGTFDVNMSNLTGRFDYLPEISLPETRSMRSGGRIENLSRENAGWANLYFSGSGKNFRTESGRFSVDGSQSIHPEMGAVEFRADTSFGSSSEFKLQTLAYNHYLNNEAHYLKVGKFYDHRLNGVSDFVGVNFGSSDLDRQDVTYYDAYEFDIQIEGPGTFKVLNGGTVIDQGTFSTNRLQITDIRESVRSGLTVEVVDRYGETHIFQQTKGDVGSRLAPWQFFWDVSAGADMDNDRYGAGVDVEMGLPMSSDLVGAVSMMSDNSYYTNLSLNNHNPLGRFGLDWYYSDVEYSDDYWDYEWEYDGVTQHLEGSYSHYLPYDIGVSSRVNLLRDEDDDFMWSIRFDTRPEIYGHPLSLNFEYSDHAISDSRYHVNMSSRFGQLFANASFSYSDEASFYVNASYSFGAGWSASTYLSDSSNRLSGSYSGDVFGATASSSRSSNGQMRHSASMNARGQYGGANFNVSDNGSSGYSTSYSMNTAVGWQDGYVDIMPNTRNGLGLIVANHDQPEDISFNYGGNDYSLAKGYSIIPVSGNSATDVRLSLDSDAAATLMSNSITFSPKTNFGHRIDINMVSGGALIYSDEHENEKGVLTVGDRRFTYFEGFGAFVEGLVEGVYPVTYQSLTTDLQCAGLLTLTAEYQELEVRELFNESQCGDDMNLEEHQRAKHMMQWMVLDGLEVNSVEVEVPQLPESAIEKAIRLGRSIEVVGHACELEAGNPMLSEIRARNARNYLVDMGIPMDMIDLDWKGSLDPISSNPDLNRRVDMRFVKRAEMSSPVFNDISVGQIDLTKEEVDVELADAQKVEIIGHACELGSEVNNIKVSRMRAEEAKRSLMEMGVPEDLIDVRWVGSSEPVSDELSENRRVEVKFVSSIEG